MKTADLTLLESQKYRVDFFDSGKLIDCHIWKDRTKVRDVLKSSGVKLQSIGSPRVKWWPEYVGDKKQFVVDDPAPWFWSE